MTKTAHSKPVFVLSAVPISRPDVAASVRGRNENEPRKIRSESTICQTTKLTNAQTPPGNEMKFTLA